MPTTQGTSAEEHVVEGDCAQITGADDGQHLWIHASHRQMVEMTDDDVLLDEVLIGHFDDVVLGGAPWSRPGDALHSVPDLIPRSAATASTVRFEFPYGGRKYGGHRRRRCLKEAVVTLQLVGDLALVEHGEICMRPRVVTQLNLPGIDERPQQLCILPPES